MITAAMGTKHTCEGCGERFYDLNKEPAVCFKCGARQSPPKPRMSRPIRSASDRGGFGGRARLVPAQEPLEAVGDVVVDDVEEVEPPDDDDLDADDVVEVEIEVDEDKAHA